MNKQDKEGEMKVIWIPQVPMKAFEVKVESLVEAKLLLNALAEYDIFQFENNIKPDFCNAGGLMIYEKIGDGEYEWTDWYNEDGDGIDDLTIEELREEEIDRGTIVLSSERFKARQELGVV